MRCAVLALFLTLPILAIPAGDVFQIENHFGDEAAWTEAYLEEAEGIHLIGGQTAAAPFPGICPAL